MKQKPERPGFNMPMEDLLILGPTKIAFTRRPDDATALAGRGWGAERISKLEDDFAAVGKLPTDTELEQHVRGIEKKKNDLRATITTMIQTVMGKVNQAHHDESAEYRAFGIRKLYDAGDPAFALLCEQISRVGQRMLADADDTETAAYEAAGLTPGDFIAIGAQGDEFRREVVDIRTAQAARDLGNQKRLRLANPAYRALAELCEVGKNVFIASDEARYNDYVIYDPEPEPKATDQQKLQATKTSAQRPTAGTGATSHLADDTATDTGGRTGGIASRDTGAGDPYTGAPTGV